MDTANHTTSVELPWRNSNLKAVVGTRDGVEILVVVDTTRSRVVTAYPISIAPNPGRWTAPRSDYVGARLRALDRHGIEWPEECHMPLLKTRCLNVTRKLEARLGQTLHSYSTPQDSTFFADVGILDELVEEGAPEYKLCATFSNFGDFVMVWGARHWMEQNPAVTDEFATILHGDGYHVLVPDDLSHPYDGVHDHWQGMTWKDRFFDYF